MVPRRRRVADARARGLVPRIQVRVRRPPLRRVERRERPPGHSLNPEVVNWYTAHAFEQKYEEDDMSKMYPWLFGAQGLYSGIKCEYPCQVIGGVCVCPGE